MHSQILLRDVAADWHCIENLHEQVVDFDIEALHDLVPKSESFGHVSRLVIASQHDDVSWEVLLDGEEQNADLDPLDAAIDIVTQEEIVKTAGLTSLADHV